MFFRKATDLFYSQQHVTAETLTKLFSGNILLPATILDFKPKLANRCKDCPGLALLCAAILDFKPKLANRCKVFPGNILFRAAILEFRHRLENRCKVSYAEFVVSTVFHVRF